MTCVKVCGAEGVTSALVSDVKQLEEAKNTLEVQLKEIKSQLERDGYNSVAQMRCLFVC